MTQSEGLIIAQRVKEALQRAKIPVREVYLFGSFARGKPHAWSDVDLAIVCDPFRETRHEENVELLKSAQEIDLRIETVCLHPEDLLNRYSTLVTEVKRFGVPA